MERRNSRGLFIMAALLLTFGAFLIMPVLWILIQSFNTGHPLIGQAEWGLDNWRVAFAQPRIWQAVGNSILIWGLTFVFSFPIAVSVAWMLARTRIPFSHALEVMFWVSFMMPSIATTIAWITLMDPDLGLLNKFFTLLPFVDKGPFNIFSIQGIVWAHLMANGISIKVMLLTPTFRNMDAALEDAGRVGGAANFGVMMRITLPLMLPIMALVIALQMLRIFQSFETEQLLGVPFGFFVYSTLIFQMVRLEDVPQYGQATALASITLLVVALIIPLQKYILFRRLYTTVSGGFKPGLIDLGVWKWIMFGVFAGLLALLTLLPLITVIFGSFMFRSGYFEIEPWYSLRHWQRMMFAEDQFWTGLRITLLLASVGAIVSPFLFSALAYILVRTRWRGRGLMDAIIWGSSAVPGILTGLGLLMLFLGTPGLNVLYGTIWALLMVVIIQGNTLGVNISKGAIIQIGSEIEEAARIAGAGWFTTYWRIWLPLMMPTLVMLAIWNFVAAAGATSSIILLADRGTTTLSILALQLGSAGRYEEASIVSIFLIAITVGVAIVARHYGLAIGIRQR